MLDINMASRDSPLSTCIFIWRIAKKILKLTRVKMTNLKVFLSLKKTLHAATLSMWTVPLIISPNEVFGDGMYGFSIAAASTAARRPWRREHYNSKNIQSISFKLYMWLDTPMRYLAIAIWYSLGTRTTAFAAKRHLYPPNSQNAISP